MATVVRIYRSTHSQQTWVVPSGVTSVVMEAWGARGGYGAGSTNSLNEFGWDTSNNTATGRSCAEDSVFVSGSINGWYNSPYWRGGFLAGSNAPGYVAGTLAVTPGTTYYLYVGGNGHVGLFNNLPFGGPGANDFNAPGGYNGGGTGGASYAQFGTYNGVQSGGGGGGATDVRVGGTALANRILVAGGSGGAGANWGYRNRNQGTGFTPFSMVQVAYNGTVTPYYSVATPYVIGGSGMGGYGGGSTAGAAERGTNAAVTALAGGVAAGAGTGAAGGAAGTNTDTDGRNGTAGSSGNGGNGGSYLTGTAPSTVLGHGGGGGGGGYFGGGGGGSGTETPVSGQKWGCGGGGGGGSNFIGGSFTSTVNAAHLWQDLHAQTPEYPWTTPPATFSGGAIRLTYQQAPDAPTIVTPGDNGRVPVDQPFDISWVWSSGASADLPTLGEGGAEITWTFSGVDTVTFVPPQVTGGAQGRTLKYTVPASTLTAGRTYTLKIRVYDETGAVSAFSTVISFRTVTAGNSPTITTPAANADMNPTSFNVVWSTNNSAGKQNLYRVQVVGLSSGASLDSGLLHGGSRVNLSPDPNMRSSTASWTATSGTLATDTKADPWSVAQCYKMTWSTKTRLTIPIATVPGVQYTFSGYWAAAASTDPAMALGAIDSASGLVLAQSATQAVAGTPGNWQRLSVTFVATGGTTLLAFLPQGGSTSVNFFSSNLAEAGPSLGLYFGTTSTSKDPGVSGTLTTNASGNFIVVTTDITSVTLGPWPVGLSEYVKVTVWASTTDSVEFMNSVSMSTAKVNKNPPGTPSATVAVDNTVGSITLHVTVSDTPNATTTVDIYRGVVGVDDPVLGGIHLANVTPPVSRVFDFVDYTPGSDVLYQYRVHANSVSGGFEDFT